MEIGKQSVRVGVLAALLIVPTAVLAEPPEFYLGGSWGAYRVDEGNLDENDDLLRAFVGGRFTEWFGVEGSWTDFNRVDNGNSRFNADGWGLAAVVSVPVGKTSHAFAKAGQFWWDADSSIGGAVGGHDGNDPFFGAGLRLGFNDHVALRLEWERYDVANIDLDTASIGVQVSF